MNGIERIAAERQRQIKKEGWSASHDDLHKGGELNRAASVYALGKDFRYLNGYLTGAHFDGEPRLTRAWPWDDRWLTLDETGDGIRNLEKAGALIAAEIDRRLRMKKERSK